METQRKVGLLRRTAVCLVFCLCFILTHAAAQGAVGIIENLSGGAYHKSGSDAKWSVAAKGAPIDEGDKVKTASDGRMVLRFEDGSKMNVGNETELEITEFILKKKNRSATFSLSNGKIRAVVNKFSGHSSIQVKTATSVAGVKGTDFIVMNQGSANVLFGKEDTVEVTGDDGKAVMLTPDKMTENTTGSNPIEPVSVEPGSQLAEVRADLEAMTDVNAPVEWARAGRLPNLLARWNINYGHYLADSQRFKEALDVFRIAIDLSEVRQTRAEAHLERGSVFSRNLNEPQKALLEYMEVIKNYPELPFVENALYSAGTIKMDMGDKQGAIELFNKYLNDYPEGRHRTTIDAFIKELEKN